MKGGDKMRRLKKFLLVIFSALFLLSLSSATFAGPPIDDGDPHPPIMPDNS